MAEPIRQEVVLPATPGRIYSAYMDSAEHEAFTNNGPASISDDVGGAFSCHGGAISGRNVELVAGKRIVQAWRVASWPAGVYSLVRIDLEPAGTQTRVKLTHDAQHSILSLGLSMGVRRKCQDRGDGEDKQWAHGWVM